MTQYIDKAAVVAEIERRRDLHYKYYMKNGAGSIAECKYDEDKDILSFLDTLEVKELNTCKAEPMSEDLELASERYACKFSNSKYGHDKVKEAIVWGANWQKEKMMKGAVESVFIQDYGYAKPVLYGDLRRALNIESRDKLKLIIIKED